jgi:hypothetical protein
MKTKLNRWGFKALSFSLAVLYAVAYLMPEPQPEGRHRAPGRATRASDRAVREQRNVDAFKRRAFAELSRVKPKVLAWETDVGVAWMDEFDVPPLPQRRFRALAPRALAASAISAREALRRDQVALRKDQEAIAGDFNRAVGRLTSEHEVS